MRVSTSVVVSPASAGWTVTPTIAPVTEIHRVLGLVGQMRPPVLHLRDFRASGSCGCVQSSLEPFLLPRAIQARQVRARRRRDARGLRQASSGRPHSVSPVSRRTMLRKAALASSVVASMPIVCPVHQAGVGQPLQHPGEHRRACVSRSIRRRVREIVE